MRFAVSLGLLALLSLAPGDALASPAPHSVVVLVNAADTDAMTLAGRYLRERDLPPSHLCAVAMPATEDVSLEDFRTLILAPLRACIDETAGLAARLEAILVVRGAPLRVAIDVGGTMRRASLAAALSLWDTTDASGTPLLGEDPGATADCGGTPCWAATWRNAYHAEPFDASFAEDLMGYTQRPVLVTMLHGRSYADAERLLDSALAAEALADGATGEFMLMEGADAARGALDREYAPVLAGLEARGFTAVRAPFDANLTGHTFAAFFTGTASIGTTIEGNDFHPGALVDNLTSFGALPINFRDAGESQVSIARWVARGVGGVHGTTDEPLNNCFPSRALVFDYVDGATLAEAYHGRLPFVYWHNLVLGDPMLAPYARRPAVSITGIEADDVSGARMIVVSATASTGRVIDELLLFVDGIEVARAEGDTLTHCLEPTGDDSVHILAVARTPYDFDAPDRPWEARGWAARSVTLRAGASMCSGGDAGASADAEVSADGGVGPGADAGPPSSSGGGCACATGRAPSAPHAILALLGLALLRGRRRWGTRRPRAVASRP